MTADVGVAEATGIDCQVHTVRRDVVGYAGASRESEGGVSGDCRWDSRTLEDAGEARGNSQSK